MNLKHKILSKVYTLKLLNLESGLVFEDRKILYADLLKSLNSDKDKACQMIESLNISGDITIDSEDFVFITEKGISKLNDKYYIIQSSKRFLSKTLEWIKIITGLVGLVITITSFVISIINKNELEQLKKDIDSHKIHFQVNKK